MKTWQEIKTMSEDIRKMIDKVKNFKQFDTSNLKIIKKEKT